MFPAAAQQNAKSLPISQYDFNKPKLFKELPDRVKVPLKNFDDVFDFEIGKTVDLPFASNFQFAGTVVFAATFAVFGQHVLVVPEVQQRPQLRTAP
jgi:hypothetical protein